MRVAVVGGAGAMGLIFGARLAQAGHDMALIDVLQPAVDAINAEGLTIVAPSGTESTVCVAATTDPSSVGVVDVLLMLVKSYATKRAATASTGLVGESTVVASLQNGLGNEEILADEFGPARVVAGVTYNSGTLLSPGRVAYTDVGPTVVGPFSGLALDHVQRVEQLLASAGFEVDISADVFAAIWKKLVVNASLAPVSALAGAPRLAEVEEAIDLVEGLGREAVLVAQALGYEIDAEERVAHLRKIVFESSGAKGSMLQDFEANRKSEVDAISGAIVRAAQKAGVRVPLHSAMLALVKAHEQARGIR